MAEITKITDCYSYLKEKIVQLFRNQPNVNLVLKAISQEFQLSLDNAYKLQDNRWVNTAYGIGLDNLGEIVGEARKAVILNDDFFKLETGPGFDTGKLFFTYDQRSTNKLSLNDDVYRTAIKAKILINHRSGTLTDLYDIVYSLTNSNYILIEDVYPASVKVTIDTSFDDTRKIFIEEKIKQALPIGVSLDSFNITT